MRNAEFKIQLCRVYPGRLLRAVRGFTLIEIMIVIATVGILVAVSYPSYKESVMKSRRADGHASLQRAAQWMEKSATIRGTYPTNQREFLDAGLTVSEEGRYRIQLRNVSVSSFTLEATPTFDDNKCRSLRLNHQGIKDASGTGGTAYCWAQ